MASGRRESPFSSFGYTPVTEEIHCELQSGHPGPHMANFSRSRWTHRWTALAWSADG
jgi:hypothetical protein